MAIKRILTGMRPTGELHLGHKVGATDLWVAAQEDPSIEQFYLIADIQALTTHFEESEFVRRSVRTMVLDWMSVGLDPSLSHVHFVLQSQVPARAILSHLLMTITPFSEVENNPTVKAERKKQKTVSAGFMVYVVDQAADILMVSPKLADYNELLVPVGEDQVPHLEDARVAARRFNQMFGCKLLMPCTPRTSVVPRLMGIDNKGKMSKSDGTAIMLTDSREEVLRKIMEKMYTDPGHLRISDKGKIEGNPLFTYHDAFNSDQEQVAYFKQRYSEGGENGIGDVEVKRALAECINDMLDPIRQRRGEVENEAIGEILREGTRRASEIAEEVLENVQKAMGIGYPD